MTAFTKNNSYTDMMLIQALILSPVITNSSMSLLYVAIHKHILVMSGVFSRLSLPPIAWHYIPEKQNCGLVNIDSDMWSPEQEFSLHWGEHLVWIETYSSIYNESYKM